MASSNRSIIINILGNDAEFQKVVRRVQGSVESLGSLSGKINGALAGFGAGLSLDYIISQNEEAQKAEGQLAAAVKSTGDAVGYTTDQLKAQAAELQQHTAFTTAEIESAQALGLTYTHIGHDIFPDFIKAAADVATRMGTDLPSAVRILGKALNDPAQGMAALKREGIDLSKTQQEQILNFQQTNQLAKAQGVILAELNKTMGGSASSAGDLSIQLKGLANDFGDAITGGGGINGFTHSVADLRKELQDPEVKSGLQGVASFLVGIVTFGAKAAGVLSEIGKGIGIIVAKMTGAKGGLDEQVYDLDQKIANAQKLIQTYIQQNGLSPDSDLVKSLQQKVIELQGERQILINDARAASYRGAQGANAGAAPAASPQTSVQTLAQAQAAFTQLQAMNQTALAELDQQYKAHNLSIAQCFAQRVTDEQKIIDAEIALKQKELAQSTDDANKQTALQGQIIALQQKRKQVAVDAATAEAEANKKLQATLEQVKIDLMKATGDDADAAVAEINAKYKDMLAEFAAEGDKAGTDLVHRLIDVDVARVQLQKLEDEVNAIFAKLSQQTQQATDEQAAGGLSPIEAASQIAAYNKEAYDSAGKLIPQMQQLQAVIGDPKAADQVAAMAAQIDHLKYVTNQWIMQIEGAGENALAQFFDDMIMHTKSLRQAFADMVQSFAAALAQMASQALAHQALLAIVNSGTTSTTSTPQLSTGSATVPMAEGGPVVGPGTETSDSIPARLSHGEFVVRAASVRKYGAHMLDAINRMVFPAIPAHFRSQVGGTHFAGGGMVAAAGAGDLVQVNVHNYSGQPATQTTRKQGNTRMVDVTIGQSAAKDIASGGTLAKSLELTYGLERRGAPRRQG